MQLESPRPDRRARCLPLLPLLPLLLLAACTSSRRDQCAEIQAAARQEMTATDNLTQGPANPGARKEHAAIAAQTASRLRAMEIRDEELKAAVQTYINALEGLSRGQEGESAAVYLTMVKASRRRIVDVCSR